MRKLIFLFFILCSSSSFGQTGTFNTLRVYYGGVIGSQLRDPSAMFDIQSNLYGFLAPRMTTTERNAIVNPANGLMIYNTTTSAFNYYNGSAWVTIASGPTIIPVAWGDSITGSPAHPNEIVSFNAAGDIYSDTNLTYEPGLFFIAEILTDTSDGAIEVTPGYTSLFSSTISGDSLTQIVLNNGLNWSNIDQLGVRYIFKTAADSKTYLFPTDTGSVGQVLRVTSNDGTGNTTLDWQTLATSGHFAPVISNDVNLTASANNIDAMWTRIGDIVTVQYSFLLDPTITLTNTTLDFTYPVAANPSADVAGQGVFSDAIPVAVAVIPVDATHGQLKFTPTATVNTLCQISITYRAN